MASVKPYIGICNCAFSKKNRPLASPSSSLLLGSSSAGSDKQRAIRGFNSVGEDEYTMFSEYKGPMLIHPR